MSLIHVDEFVVEESLLSNRGYILEIGSASYKLADAMIAKGYIHFVIEPDIRKTFHPKRNFIAIHKAVIGDSRTDVKFIITESVWAPHLEEVGFNYHGMKKIAKISVEATTIEAIMQKYGIPQFDVIFMDCEGAEEQILMSLKKTVSKQIAVEFHVQCGQPVEIIDKVTRQLESIGYTMKHKWEENNAPLVQYRLFTV